MSQIGGIVLVENADGATPGKATFHLEPITGQNNSPIEHFLGFPQNRRNAGLGGVSTRAVEVDVVTLDNFYASSSGPVAFVKIDVEGSE
jgi:FkbM family methyltransferase